MIERFMSSPAEREFALGGFAGTGKTTLIKRVSDRYSSRCVAFTGKAAYVLRSKGIPNTSTIHKLIYRATDVCEASGESLGKCKECPEGECSPVSRFVLDEDKQKASVVIVDEASMVTSRIYDDLMATCKKVLWVGDHGQLEPIGESADIMNRCDVKLEQIHRQAEGSNVLRLAHSARTAVKLETLGDDAVVLRARKAPSDLARFDAVLCGRNSTRVQVNKSVRRSHGYATRPPQPGERVIFLKNNSEMGVFNGMSASIITYDQNTDRISVVDDAGTKFERLPVRREQFHQQKTLKGHDPDHAYVDFGYAMTVHKSQGSEWDDVCVLEWIHRDWSASRWRYTAITRAAKTVTYCMPP